MNLYRTNNDYGKQIKHFKFLQKKIKYLLDSCEDMDSLLILLTEIGFSYDMYLYEDDDIDVEKEGIIEYTGTSPCMIDTEIWKLYNKEVVVKFCFYQQRLFVSTNPRNILKLKDINEDECSSIRSYLTLVKTYFSKFTLPFALTYEYQKEILKGEFLEYENI